MADFESHSAKDKHKDGNDAKDQDHAHTDDQKHDHSGHGHSHGHGAELLSKDGKISKTSAVLLVVALSTHSIFEGIALGLQSEFGDTWKLALGIALHHIPAAISLGGTCCRSGYSLKLQVAILSMFAICVPTGTLIGYFLEGSSEIVEVVFMSLSAGTFIYVSCTEIITHEFELRYRQWLQFLLALLGCGVITGLWFIEEGEHAH